MSSRGIALPIALCALAAVGALVAAVFVVTIQEGRMQDGLRSSYRANAVAEAGAYEVLQRWPGAARLPLALPPRLTPLGTGRYSALIRALNRDLFVLEVIGIPQRSLARASVGLLVRLAPLEYDPPAALTTQGPLSLESGARVAGEAQTPAGWSDCQAPDSAHAGILTTDGVDIALGADVSGQPPTARDASLSDSTFLQIGTATFGELRDRAAVTLAPGSYTTYPMAAGDACATDQPRNWGDGLDPSGACRDFYPIVHVAGDLLLTAGQGQGILLVEGDLEVRGAYQYFGLIVVRGAVRLTEERGGAPEIWGAVLADNARRAAQQLASGAAINYSKCVIQKVLRRAGRAVPLRSRAYFQAFEVP